LVGWKVGRLVGLYNGVVLRCSIDGWKDERVEGWLSLHSWCIIRLGWLYNGVVLCCELAKFTVKEQHNRKE